MKKNRILQVMVETGFQVHCTAAACIEMPEWGARPRAARSLVCWVNGLIYFQATFAGSSIEFSHTPYSVSSITHRGAAASGQKVQTIF